MLVLAKYINTVKIALLATFLAATLQATTLPSKEILFGDVNGEFLTFLFFAIMKVLSFATLSLLFARAIINQETSITHSAEKKANHYLTLLLIANLAIALYLFVAMRIVSGDSFISFFGDEVIRKIAALLIFISIYAFFYPLYHRTYYDLSIMMGVDLDYAKSIKRDRRLNKKFLNGFIRYYAIYFIPLFTAHFFLAEYFIKISPSQSALLLDAIVTCALAITAGGAMAKAHQIIRADYGSNAISTD